MNLHRFLPDMASPPPSRVLLSSFALLAACTTAAAQAPAPSTDAWQAGVVLDFSAASRALALAQRPRGLALGHSDFNLAGPVGRHFQAGATLSVHSGESSLEAEPEEAWIETR
ncbi:MAG TPA: hypothetical protein VIL30_14090, partial [Ramlibacter sp.]